MRFLSSPDATPLFHRLRRMLALLQLQWRVGLRLGLLGLAIQGVSLLGPYLSSSLIDYAYPTRDVTLMHALVAATAGTLLGGVWLGHARVFSGKRLQAVLQGEVSSRLYAQVLKRPLDYFDRRPPGDIASRLEAVRSSMGAIVTGLQSVMSNTVYFMAVPPLLLATDARLAAIALAAIPFSAYLSYRQYAATNENVRIYLDHWAQASAFQAETVGGVRSIKGLDAETYCTRQFMVLTERATAAQIRRYTAAARYGAAINALRATSVVGCTWLGWELTVAGELTLGRFMAFMAYLTYLHSPMREVIEGVAGAQEASVSLDAAADDLDQPTEDARWRPVEGAAIRSSGAAAGPLACHDLAFAYEGHQPLWRGVRLRCDPGTMTVLLGPSGCGKTTMLQVIAGFRQPTQGAVTIGGLDIRRWPLRDLRARLSVVWQDDLLLSASFWDNLTLGLDAERRSVNRILEQCQLIEVLERLPDGYSTRVGEGGVYLSAGERQRIAIARAVIRKTPILLFDEATAHLDAACERRMLAELVPAWRDNVVLFVTHRATAAAFATQVVDVAGWRNDLDDAGRLDRAAEPLDIRLAGHAVR